MIALRQELRNRDVLNDCIAAMSQGKKRTPPEPQTRRRQIGSIGADCNGPTEERTFDMTQRRFAVRNPTHVRRPTPVVGPIDVRPLITNVPLTFAQLPTWRPI